MEGVGFSRNELEHLIRRSLNSATWCEGTLWRRAYEDLASAAVRLLGMYYREDAAEKKNKEISNTVGRVS